MGFLRNEDNFVKNQLVREAINHVVFVFKSKDPNTIVDEELVERVFLHYFLSLKKLIINQLYKRISVYSFGHFNRRMSPVEKALIQLEKEQRIREHDFDEV